jgi:hypothetical protein
VKELAKVPGHFMKNSPLITFLLVAVCLLAVCVGGLEVAYEFKLRTLRKLQPQVINAQNMQASVNALANDALEYSKHNPAIDPILQPVGVKPGKASTPSTPPSGKTNGK